jgi:uncharacterized protein YyaL (SSP411 family)
MISGNFSFLMSYYSWCPGTDNGKKALKMTLRILDAMDNGGIHDHVGQVGLTKFMPDTSHASLAEVCSLRVHSSLRFDRQ